MRKGQKISEETRALMARVRRDFYANQPACGGRTDRVESLREWLYISENGNVCWLKSDPYTWKVRAGTVAGTLSRFDGYRRIKIGAKLYLAHRIAFAIAHGRWPESLIDHINGIGSDNRPENLREATASQNNCNRMVQKNSKSGVKGVFLAKRAPHGRPWEASITVKKFIGYFATKEEAAAAYRKAALELHGEFAPTDQRIADGLETEADAIRHMAAQLRAAA